MKIDTIKAATEIGDDTDLAGFLKRFKVRCGRYKNYSLAQVMTVDDTWVS